VEPIHPIVRYGRYGAVAFEFTGGIAAGALIGGWLDSRFGTQPWGLLLLTLLAVVGGFVRMVRVLRRFDRGDPRRQP
jgi:F0F1-type ATP synthase assembly protein I